MSFHVKQLLDTWNNTKAAIIISQCSNSNSARRKKNRRLDPCPVIQYAFNKNLALASLLFPWPSGLVKPSSQSFSPPTDNHELSCPWKGKKLTTVTNVNKVQNLERAQTSPSLYHWILLRHKHDLQSCHSSTI